MWNMIWPILIVVLSNVAYNICTKSTPESVNGFASLSVTYGVGTLCSFLLFLITAKTANIAEEFAKVNWTAWLLGIAIVGLEFGYICIYRAGWKMGIATLMTSISLACVLLLIGTTFYREIITLRQIIGIAVCTIGLFLITE